MEGRVKVVLQWCEMAVEVELQHRKLLFFNKFDISTLDNKTLASV